MFPCKIHSLKEQFFFYCSLKILYNNNFLYYFASLYNTQRVFLYSIKELISKICDAGIIASLNAHYRKHLIEYMSDSFVIKGEIETPNLKLALEMLIGSWKEASN